VFPVEQNAGTDRARDGVPPIEFVTDGRIYEPAGAYAGKVIVVFGTMVTGPTAPQSGTSSTVDFPARLTRPDGTTTLVDDARIDFPIADESPGEGPTVILFGARAADAPAGTLIVPRGRSPLEPKK
jgi:hypothetical protein